MEIIDPHIHLFNLQQGQYHWLSPENPPFWPEKAKIKQNFSERDLLLTSPLTLAGFVHIEAGFDNQQPWREIAWLETSCQGKFRSIAMIDLTLEPVDFCNQIKHLMAFESVVGVRYILDEQAFAILSNKHCLINLQHLAQQQLRVELQFSLFDEQAVNQLVRVLTQHKNLMCCINHAGLQQTYWQKNKIWQQNLMKLSVFTNLYIKCSGFEMFDRQFNIDFKKRVIEQCIQAFGISRVMLASNFPLSTWKESYQQTWISNTALPFTTHQLQQLCYENAYWYYKF